MKEDCRKRPLRMELKTRKWLYILSGFVITYYLVFHYAPMYGVLIAFKDYKVAKGFMGSPWAGLKNFESFFGSMYFTRVVGNTLVLNLLGLLFGFPAPILLALLLNELKAKKFKKLTQTITYIPHFISMVVICGMIVDFVSQKGVINDLISFFGGSRQNLLLNEAHYRTVYIVSGIWQGVGWGSIIYLAALTGINSELYEAAAIDGAGRLKQCLHVTLPGILPTIVVMLILNIGRMLSEGPEKTLLLYNPTNYAVSDIISTFVYRKGLVENNYGYASAVGIFNSVINCTLLVASNQVSKKLTESSLW